MDESIPESPTRAGTQPAPDPDWYRAIVETAPDATVLVDSDGIIRLVNRQTERLFGYSRHELVGQPVEILVPEDLRTRHEIHREGFFADPKVREMGAGIELQARRRDGSQIAVEISLSPMETGGRVWVIASIRDATARRRSRQQILDLLESAPDAMVVADEAGIIRLVNRQTERLFGYRREVLIGKPVEALVPMRLRERHRLHRAGYYRTPKVREMGAGLELAGRRRSGEEFPVEISLSPLQTEQGTWVIAAVRDVTERKETHRKLQAYARHLEESNQQLEQFAYIASHDLQAPLRNVISFSQLLVRELQLDPGSRAGEFLRHIEDSARRMPLLVRDILALSRIGRSAKPFGDVDLGALAQRVADELQGELAHCGGRIEVEPLPVVHGDATELGQLLGNLIGNAVKFRHPDRPPLVRVGARQLAEGWEIHVDDNGIGIPPAERERIFEIFYRSPEAIDTPGTGIGLAICRRIAERHGGHIAVAPSERGGSRFTVFLPRPPAAAPSGEGAA